MVLFWSNFCSKIAILGQFRRQIGHNLIFLGVWKLKIFVVTSSFRKTVFHKNKVYWKVPFLTKMTRKMWSKYFFSSGRVSLKPWFKIYVFIRLFQKYQILKNIVDSDLRILPAELVFGFVFT